jgi:uncharacterized membrane protein YphA (DoxX/SURF4 family)
MFSLFPTLLDFHLFAALLLRVVAGYVFIMQGRRVCQDVSHTRITYSLGLVQVIIGALLVVGAWVQGAAIVGAVITFFGVESMVAHESTPYERERLVILWAVCVSLIVLGAGPYAFDIPL